MSDDKEQELAKSLENVACPRCYKKGSLVVKQEMDVETDEIVFVMICTEDDCNLWEKGVRV